jgi:predicted metalloprotease with PDZ domain
VITTPLQYTCDLANTRQRRIKVTLRIDLAVPVLEVYLPELSPGSTVNSQGHPANLLNFRAEDANGETLHYEKLPQGGYRLPPDLKGPVQVTYEVRAERFSDVHDQLMPDHVYLNGPATFMAVRGYEHDTPAILTFINIPSPEWQSSSTLPRVLEKPHTFYSASYDDIADDNVVMGKLSIASDRIGRATITVAQMGTGPYKGLEKPGATPEENVHDFARIGRAFLHNFGPFPNPDGQRPPGIQQGDEYVVHKFYLHDGPDVTDGLEHFRGNEMIRHAASEDYIRTEFGGSARANENYTMAHEVVHKLLAKFVQREGIDAHDLQHAQRTDGLWVTEGITNWTGYLLERQSGMLSVADYLKRGEGAIEQYYRDYAENPTNARDDSLDAQLGNGRYYNKGSLCGLAIDLELRHISSSSVSLLDVLRKIKTEFGGSGHYHRLEDIQRLTREVAAPYGGAELVDRFFADHLVDRKRIELDKYLEYAGLTLDLQGDSFKPVSVPTEGAILSVNEKGELSVTVDASAVSPRSITNVPIATMGLSLAPFFKTAWYIVSGGPADEAGLLWYQGKIPSQVLLRTPQGEVDLKYPRDVAFGEVEAMVFRYHEKSLFDGEDQSVEVVVLAQPATRLVLRSLDHVTDAQQALRDAWLAQLPEDVLSGQAE